MTLIYVIRHAQASWGEADYDKLSELGRSQSGALGRHFAERGFRPDIVFTGQMRRHRDTAALCMEQLAMYPEIDTLPGLDEYDFTNVFSVPFPQFKDMSSMGGAAGAKLDFRKIVGEALRAWTAPEAEEDARYAETFPAFRGRARGALDEIARRATARQAERVLVFTSGGPVGALTLDVMGAPASRFADIAWRIANCSVTKLQIARDPVGEDAGESVVKLVSFNDFSAMETKDGLLTFR